MTPTPIEINRQRHWVCALQMAERRRHLGLTQQDVVDRLVGLGVGGTNRTLSAMEHGQGIDIGRLPELAIALECTVTYLLGLTTNPVKWTPDDGTVPTGPAAAVRTTPGDQGCWLHYPSMPEARVTANARPGLQRFAGRA
jgi:hypothetical protein